MAVYYLNLRNQLLRRRVYRRCPGMARMINYLQAQIIARGLDHIYET